MALVAEPKVVAAGYAITFQHLECERVRVREIQHVNVVTHARAIAGRVIVSKDRHMRQAPCRHVQELTEPGMTKALRRRGGICARVVEGGAIRAEDAIEVL